MATALVTGAASGIGAATAARLTAEGWEVIGADLVGADVIADLATPEGRSHLIDDVGARCNGVLDGVVACAGLGPHVNDRALIASVNYFGAVATLDGLFGCLAGGHQPAAVAIASNSLGMIPPDPSLEQALLADDEPAARAAAATLDGPTVYGTTKRALAVAVRRRVETWGAAGVRCNAVAPGPVDTPLLAATAADLELGPLADALPIPLGRTGRPDEIASVVAFLLSEQSSLLHGALVWADGGTDALMRPDQV